MINHTEHDYLPWIHPKRSNSDASKQQWFLVNMIFYPWSRAKFIPKAQSTWRNTRHLIHALISTSCNDVHRARTISLETSSGETRGLRQWQKGASFSLERISVRNDGCNWKRTRTSHNTERKRTEPWLAVQSPYQTPSLPPPHRVLPHQPSVITSHHPLLTRSPRISRSTVRTIRQTSLFAFETPPDTSGNAFASRFSLIFPSPQIAPSFFTALDVHSLDASPWCRSATPHAYSYMSIYRISSLSNVGLSRCDATSHTFCHPLEYLSRIIYVLPCAPLYRSRLFSIVMNHDIYQNCAGYNFSSCLFFSCLKYVTCHRVFYHSLNIAYFNVYVSECNLQ